jgi:carboxymethylenebutenolidase
MSDKQMPSASHGTQSVSRREFAALTVAAGVAAATGIEAAQAAAAATVTDVEVRTPSGVCDAALAEPQGAGRWPAVVMFPDAFGLRPVLKDMALRLAREGFVVLVPNPFYRSARAPGIGPDFDFQKPADRAALAALRAPLTNDAVAEDAKALIAYLDTRPNVARQARAGVVGYCMGGLMTMQAAAGVPGRIGAGASFHGGGLVTDKPDSAHLLVPRMRAEFYFGVAANDDASQPDAKTQLADAFRAARLTARVEVYEGTLHGWCVPGPRMAGERPIYNEAQAERAWRELVTLFTRTLV